MVDTKIHRYSSPLCEMIKLQSDMEPVDTEGWLWGIVQEKGTTLRRGIQVAWQKLCEWAGECRKVVPRACRAEQPLGRLQLCELDEKTRHWGCLSRGHDPHFHTVTLATGWRTARKEGETTKGTKPDQAGGDDSCHGSTGSMWQILIYWDQKWYNLSTKYMWGMKEREELGWFQNGSAIFIPLSSHINLQCSPQPTSSRPSPTPGPDVNTSCLPFGLI